MYSENIDAQGYAEKAAALTRGKYQPRALGDSCRETAQRQGDIPTQLDQLARACEVLSITAEHLTERLAPLRCQTGANTSQGKAVSAPEPVLCSIASALRDRRQQIERYTEQLQTALNELEI